MSKLGLASIQRRLEELEQKVEVTQEQPSDAASSFLVHVKKIKADLDERSTELKNEAIRSLYKDYTEQSPTRHNKALIHWADLCKYSVEFVEDHHRHLMILLGIHEKDKSVFKLELAISFMLTELPELEKFDRVIIESSIAQIVSSARPIESPVTITDKRPDNGSFKVFSKKKARATD